MPLVPVQQARQRRESGPRLDSIVSIRSKDEDRISQSDQAGPHEVYFGKHRWDPDISWTAEEEKHVVRKTDLRLLGCFCVIIICIQIDKHNLSNALTDNFLKDSRLSSTDYDNGLMLSRIGLLLSEFPVQLAVLRYGFRRVFPPMILCWGVVSSFQCMISNRMQFLALRFLLGLFEGYSPGMIYFFTQFYLNAELTSRLATMAVMANFAHILASLCAAGILKMRGIAGKPGWFWLFLIEGVMTFGVGVFCYLYLPHSPTRTNSVVHRKSWYTEREECILVNRVLRDDPSKGQVGTTGNASYKDVLKAWSDKTLWIFYMIGLIGVIAYLPVKQYLSLTLRRLGFSTFKSNMLAVPCAVLQMITVLAVSLSSRRFNEHTWHSIAAHLFGLPLLVALEVMPASAGMWERYSCTMLIVGSPSFYPILLSWLSGSCLSVKKRAIAISTFSSLTIVGAIVAAHIYRKGDEPYYYTGNKVLIAAAVLACVLLAVQRSILVRINRNRDRAWQEMSMAEQADYQQITKRLEFDGNKRLDFRFPV